MKVQIYKIWSRDLVNVHLGDRPWKYLVTLVYSTNTVINLYPTAVHWHRSSQASHCKIQDMLAVLGRHLYPSLYLHLAPSQTHELLCFGRLQLQRLPINLSHHQCFLMSVPAATAHKLERIVTNTPVNIQTKQHLCEYTTQICRFEYTNNNQSMNLYSAIASH